MMVTTLCSGGGGLRNHPSTARSIWSSILASLARSVFDL